MSFDNGSGQVEEMELVMHDTKTLFDLMMMEDDLPTSTDPVLPVRRRLLRNLVVIARRPR